MSLLIKVSQDGNSREYLFNKLGPICIGSDPRCDLKLDDPHLEGRVLEVKLSGGIIFVKELGRKAEVYLDSVILPFREETKYDEGSCISFKNTNYQLSIQNTSAHELTEPPPFLEGEFKDRIEFVSSKIHERESQLHLLEEKEEKRKRQLCELDEKYRSSLHVKSGLESQISRLCSERDALLEEMRKSQVKNEDADERVDQLKEYMLGLQEEERSLKERILAQNLVLANLKDEQGKKLKELEQQRSQLSELELMTAKAKEEILRIDDDVRDKESAIQNENTRIEKLLNTAQVAKREECELQSKIALTMQAKFRLDQEVKALQTTLHKLETERHESQAKLLELKLVSEAEELRSQKLKEDNRRQEEIESNLKLLANDIRAELGKIEEKLSNKRNQLGQLDFQTQEVSRKLSALSFELERSSLRLRDLVSEEKVQELKVLSLKEELKQSTNRISEEKKQLQKDFDSERLKLQTELENMRREIEREKGHFAEVLNQRALLEEALRELETKNHQFLKEKTSLESEVLELRSQKRQYELMIGELTAEVTKLHRESDFAQRELGSFQLKLKSSEDEIRERLEEAKLEVESLKREERAKILVEKDVAYAEVEAFRQKSLAEVEVQFRRKEEELHQLKLVAMKEADEILREARRTEQLLTQEASQRLKLATTEAQEREKASHERILEAQHYFQEKEREAEAIVHKARLESNDLLSKTEAELLDDLAKRKTKIKKFLTMKQEMGLAHLKLMADQQLIRLKRQEEKAGQKLEELKRKELKKVARVREEELSKHTELKEAAMREVKELKEKAIREFNELKRGQEAELAEKKKYMLDHINQQKYRTQETWEAELKREREEFQRTKKDRILNATHAVMNVFIAEAGSPGEKEEALKEKIKSTLEMAIDGQRAGALKEVDQILDFNPIKRKKVIPVIKKYTLRFGLPMAAAIMIVADVSNVRTNIVSSTLDLLKQQQSASEIYVSQQKEEWKEKHTYTPLTTPDYKATYTDNVIYTTDFEKVMENEEFQNDWILKVHDFMVKELELSEDVAINFISAEGTVVKELGTIRKDLHPQFLDQGLKKMRDLEASQMSFLIEKIPDELKMKKFVTFRKDYFEKFYSEKFMKTPVRELATEKSER